MKSCEVKPLIRISDDLLCGGEPLDTASFRSLAKLGVKWIVSVDGARPKVELAARHGMRYVHIPIGYDGVPREASLALTRVAREAEGPIYVHCHHGKHRGPAAAAIIARSLGAITSESATIDLLNSAGADRRYTGLWRDAITFRPPPDGAHLPKLVAVAEVDPFVEAMAAAGRALSAIESGRDRHAALLLREAMRESNRAARQSYDTEADGELIAWLHGAESAASELESTSEANRDAAQRLNVRKHCQRCHTRYRD